MYTIRVIMRCIQCLILLSFRKGKVGHTHNGLNKWCFIKKKNGEEKENRCNAWFRINNIFFFNFENQAICQGCWFKN